MNRRQFIGSAAAVSLTAAASFARAHDHAGHASHAGHAHSAPRAYEAARKAAAHCVEAGQICLAHCIALLSEGDTSMMNVLRLTDGVPAAMLQERTGVPTAKIMAQNTVAEAVERAEPHGADVDGNHRAQTGLHFFGGFVGKRYRHNAVYAGLPALQQPCDARG